MTEENKKIINDLCLKLRPILIRIKQLDDEIKHLETVMGDDDKKLMALMNHYGMKTAPCGIKMSKYFKTQFLKVEQS